MANRAAIDARLAELKRQPIQPLNVAVAQFAEFLKLAPAVVTEKLSLDLWNRIVERNPVDTGLSRSHWKISEGQPDTTPPPPRPGSPDSIPKPDPPAPEITGTQSVFITNNVDYVKYLEAGTSDQAPGGMVALAILETEAEVETILRKGGVIE